ncbi:MAG: UPF0175 family protein [Candidatus Altiarchaeales archaeon]|nr:UPF0175 family protein [Candidatus Altiarchaeota archaeon]MCG2783288.1 UPF0175 family protein [Candidatus Altiarchaeales archaeon]MBU4265856.1 UPF0175 family protein [Candidatus Altiarchaeota archaeon]MBU4341293.1 UPF0175 family protein [Candidatus Altiarchaeota archaeon]MBU4406746.1 UPF0175 family protein [Candidatus Altiarchaeota archaeon]
METKVISARVPVAVEKEIEEFAREKNYGKTKLFREIILTGLQKVREKHALDLYEQGRITLWRAAEMAGLSLWEMQDKVGEKKIPVKYDVEDAKEDIRLVFGG